MIEINSKEIFGAEIQYFRLEPEYWEKMIVLFKNSGLRCVTTYVQWATHLIGPPDEDNPAGIFDFEGKTDPKLNLVKFLELVEKYELNLNFRCGPFCCNEMLHGGLPSWIVMGDPNMMVWDYQNRTTQGYWIAKHEGSQPSYLHPKYLKLCKGWIKAVDKIILPHLKKNGGCITMLNLDNEISYIVQDGFLTSDYNPVNVAPGGYYHQFLRSKYGSIEKLPYDTKYESFESIPAPRAVPETIDKDLPYYLDWCEFKEWVMCRYIEELRKMHEENGITAENVLFMTNFNPHLPEGIPTRMPSFEASTKGITGYDFYRGTFMSYSGYHSMARVLKLMNSSLKYTWSAEFMAGTWEKVLNSRVSDDHMRFMARCALAHGCKSISWFMFHDRDCWGDSPASIHAHRRPSMEVLKEIPKMITEKINDWESLVPQGDVAVIYDVVQHRHTYLGDPSPCADNNLYMGAPYINGVEAGKSSREYFGLFRLIEEAGYQADVVDIVHTREIPEKYPLVFVPGSPVIHTVTENILKSYVEDGGVVLLTGAWPSINQDGVKIDFIPHNPQNAGESAEVISFGKGKLIWSKQFIAQDEPEQESIESIDFMKHILSEHNVKPYVKIINTQEMKWVDWSGKGGSITYVQPRNLGSTILQINDKESILYVLNHYTDAAKFSLEFKDQRYTRLINIDSEQIIDIQDAKCTVDIDRKSCEIFLLE